MRTALVTVVALVSLSGCASATYLREQPEAPKFQDDLPKGCVELWKHTTGHNTADDNYEGVYCEVEQPKIELP